MTHGLRVLIDGELLAVALLGAVVAALVWGRGNGARRILWAALAGAHLGVVAALTVVPDGAGWGLNLSPPVNLLPTRTIAAVAGGPARVYQLLGNVALLAPAGFLLPLAVPGLRRGLRVVLVGAWLSAGIEVVQLVLTVVGTRPSRAADVDDLLLNVLGVALGRAVLWLLARLGAAVR